MKQKIKSLLKKFYIFSLKILRFFYCKKRVVFISFSGEQFSDNPKAISDKLHQISPKTKQIWFFVNPEKMKSNVPKYVKVKKFNMKTILLFLASSQVWVDNDFLVYSDWLRRLGKTKKQLFIETWHGDRGFKKCFYSVPTYKRAAPFSLENTGICDYVITASKFAENVVKEMFHLSDTTKLLRVGYPRNDLLFKNDQSEKNKIKKQLGIPTNSCILLYAPTFRKNKLNPKIRIDFDKILSDLEKSTHKNWVLAYRAHHLIKRNLKIKNAIDVSKYGDMSELLYASDMLITDFSSCAGDFVLANKPVLLYIPDLDQYGKKDRGLHFDIKSSPYFYATTQDELSNIISSLTPQKTRKNCQAVREFYGAYENGTASEKTCNIILKHLYPTRK